MARLQETTAAIICDSPSPSASIVHGDLSNSRSQSLPDTATPATSHSYYGPTVQAEMQSTSGQEPKASKKRDPASCIRHGFVIKRGAMHGKSSKCNGVHVRTGSQRSLCPEAPRNTTSFLIDDYEERARREVSPPSPPISPTLRGRCCSTSAGTAAECSVAKLLSKEAEDTETNSDDAYLDEYYDMINSVSWNKLADLSRDEINRQLMHVEEHNRDLIFHFTKLRQENDALRELLRANGIDLPNEKTN